VTVALSTGSQGTPAPVNSPGGAPWISKILYFACNANVASWKLQIPSIGNFGMFTEWNQQGTTPMWTSLTDSDANSWTITNVSGAPELASLSNLTPKSNRTITIALNATGNNFNAIYYDISNAATSPIAATAGVGSTGVNNTNSATSQPSITPTATNQLTIAWMQNGLGPTLGFDGSLAGVVWDNPMSSTAQFTGTIATTTLTVSATAWGTVTSANTPAISGTNIATGTTIQSGTGPFTTQPSNTVSTGETMLQSSFDSDTHNLGNGAAHYFNGASTAAQNWGWFFANQPSNSVSSFAVVLKGQPASAGGTPMRTLMGVGQ
jgi:hypothetical protein